MKLPILILLALFTAVFAGPVSYYGKLEARGAMLYGSNTGRPVIVKGVSFFWSEWAAPFYNENAVDRMAQDWKAEVVRAAYGATGYAFEHDSSVVNRARIETIVDAAIKNDIYVIIDWHSHAAHEAVQAERARQFFAYFAEKYGSYDNVIFELYNEPQETSWNTIKAYAESVIPEIRPHSDNLILVGTQTWSQKIQDVIGKAIDDPNVGYVLHFYAASHSLSNFRNNIAAVQTAGLPIFVTEFGTTDADGGNPNACDQNTGVCRNNYNTHSAERTDEWLTFLNGRGISYCAWSLFDKYEGSAFFGTGNPFDQTIPANWTNTTLMTASGAYILNMLLSSYERTPWNPNNISPVLAHGKVLNNALRAANGNVYIDIASGGNTRIDAYSLNGTLLKTVFNGNLNAGSHKFALNIPKGAFILRLSQKNDNNVFFLYNFRIFNVY